jgi:hypothetical protein
MLMSCSRCALDRVKIIDAESCADLSSRSRSLLLDQPPKKFLQQSSSTLRTPSAIIVVVIACSIVVELRDSQTARPIVDSS